MSARRTVAALGLSLLMLACAGDPSLAAEEFFTGRIVLRGTLAEAESGSVRVDVWADPDRDLFPLLTRRYALDDPAFERDGAELVLRFELDARHRKARWAEPRPAATAVEATFEPRGLLAAALGGEVTARAGVVPDGESLEVVLSSSVAISDDPPD